MSSKLILCIDIGNSHIFAGVFKAEQCLLLFRYPSITTCTSDQLGVFLRNVLRENNLNPEEIQHVSISSVVPSLDYSVHSAILKYFKLTPFVLKAGVKTGLKIDCKNPVEIGSDRIANAIAATSLYPDKNIIIVDLGTAMTIDIISQEKIYLGGLILPGINIAVKALHENTAKLPHVNILKPNHLIGKTTIENIQSGAYYGTLGSINYITQKIKSEKFQNQNNIIILGTGGFAYLFDQENIFDCIMPNLVLQGLLIALNKNI